ncbi:ribose ABC transporter, permease protein [Pyrococcus sp. NA2]|uniref:ABC transporter permease n=1 Tax=Pyrococcus sp. (strain NA2) TaxID=342949 RepID=UPI000209A8E9|nr:ABC transporter permease [Pyrococcus sp. NA2]AEC51231.1 ribose ABC transporter, permease protein [Pyrococcus sp. NA2]
MIADILNVLSNTFISMVPLTLAAVGEIITEKSGVVNIGLEGIFILSAFTSTVVTFYTGNPYLGLLVGIIVGALSGVLHGAISVYLKGDQIIAGVGFNSLAYGISILSLVSLWHSHGSSPSVEKIPMIGKGSFFISPLTPLAIIVGILAWWWLYKTPSGLKLRACGEDPKAAEAMGVNVHRTRFYATVIGASLTGLGGAYLVVGWIGQFTKFISAGRGFIALANVAFSNWNPLMAIVGGFIFGFFDALAIYLPIKIQQITGKVITAESNLFRTIPYLATLIIVSLIMKKVKMPRALGKPYIKE